VVGKSRCIVVMEACFGVHFWGREVAKPRHEVRLVPPTCAKPFTKRQKSALADAAVRLGTQYDR
jgi:transposase